MEQTIEIALLALIVIGMWRDKLLNAVQFFRDAFDIALGDKKVGNDGRVQDIEKDVSKG